MTDYLINVALYFGSHYAGPLFISLVVTLLACSLGLYIVKNSKTSLEEEQASSIKKIKFFRRTALVIVFPMITAVCLALSLANPQYTYKHNDVDVAEEQYRESQAKHQEEKRKTKEMEITLENARDEGTTEEREQHFDDITNWKKNDE